MLLILHIINSWEEKILDKRVSFPEGVLKTKFAFLDGCRKAIHPCHCAGKQAVLKERSKEKIWVLTVPKGERQINGVKNGTLVRYNNGGKRIKMESPVSVKKRSCWGGGGGVWRETKRQMHVWKRVKPHQKRMKPKVSDKTEFDISWQLRRRLRTTQSEKCAQKRQWAYKGLGLQRTQEVELDYCFEM